MTEEKPQTLKELNAAIAVASAAGDIPEVIRLGKLMLKSKSDVEKAEADKQKAEAEALAGDREKLAVKVYKAVKAAIDPTELEAVKATGFTFNLDGPDKNGVMTTYKSVALSVPAVKARGGGGGSTGALKEKTGLSRHELIDQFATDTEKATIAQAEADATSRPDSARYSAEKPAIKRILAENPHLIKR